MQLLFDNSKRSFSRVAEQWFQTLCSFHLKQVFSKKNQEAKVVFWPICSVTIVQQSG